MLIFRICRFLRVAALRSKYILIGCFLFKQKGFIMPKQEIQWTVIGSGPAGVAAVGNLLDSGIEGKHIMWMDPDFNAGDLEKLWSNVSSNTSVQLFFDYFTACKSFEFEKAPIFELNKLNQLETCVLKHAVEPLKWVIENLQRKVSVKKGTASEISMNNNHWLIKIQDEDEFLSKNVILATGAEPRSLSLGGVEEIPLEIALDKSKLKLAIEGKTKVGVFGSSHSAVIIMRDLLEFNVSRVDNFYLGPLRYAVFFDDWVLFDDTGLKGNTAKWARQNLHGNLPKGLSRHLSNPENLKKYFEDLDAVIYATGFKRKKINIKGMSQDFDYNAHCGIIAPGIFGVGVGFPEKKIDRFGHQEMSVGLWKFMNYVKRVMPVWLNYGL